MESDNFDWGQLPYEWWIETGKTVGADIRHCKFAAVKHRGGTNTEAARLSGFGAGSSTSTRSEGYRVARSNKVNQLLALAAAEAGGGYDGTLTKQEARGLLTAMARGSDPNVKIKSIELLNKLEKEEAAANAQPELTLEQELAGLICAIPESGCGAFLALSCFRSKTGNLVNFPFLTEVAPVICKNFPGEWQRWRGKEKVQWALDFVDKLASGPILEDDALVAAIKHKSPASFTKPKPTNEEAAHG